MFDRSADLYDSFYSYKDYAAEAEQLVELIRRHNRKARSILDVACGTGKHLAQLRERFHVEGLDLDPNLLEIAGRRLPGVPLHEADMGDFDLGRQFDVITCLFSSIAYVRTPDRLAWTFERFRRHLAPGGICVVEPWFYRDVFESGYTFALEVDQGSTKMVRLSTSRRRGDESEMEFHYLVADGEAPIEHFEETHVLGLFSPADYVKAQENAGLSLVHYDATGFTDRGLFVSRAL